MRPEEYFPKWYLKDLKDFFSKEVTSKGPQWKLCGITMGNILEPQNRPQYESVENFITVLYELNLINQGIHCHFNEDFQVWCEISTPFPDCRACSSFHGGITSPYSILKFIRKPFYIPDAEPVSINRRSLKEYTHYFFKDYLKEVEDTGRFRSVTSERLIRALTKDSDCSEFRMLIASNVSRSLASRPRPKVNRKVKPVPKAKHHQLKLPFG